MAIRSPLCVCDGKLSYQGDRRRFRSGAGFCSSLVGRPLDPLMVFLQCRGGSFLPQKGLVESSIFTSFTPSMLAHHQSLDVRLMPTADTLLLPCVVRVPEPNRAAFHCRLFPSNSCPSCQDLASSTLAMAMVRLNRRDTSDATTRIMRLENSTALTSPVPTYFASF